MGAFSNTDFNKYTWTDPSMAMGYTSNTGNFYVTSSTAGTWDVSGIQIFTGTDGTFYNSLGIDDLKKIASDARKWGEDLVKKSPNFTDLRGMCGLVSRKIHKDLKKRNVESKLAYINNSSYQHIFVIVSGKTDNNVRIKKDHIVDVTASLFGEDDVCILDLSTYDPISQPWWNYDQAYASENSLILRQKKDKWPRYQITIQAAKTKQTKLELVMVGDTDLEKGLIRIKPFDVDAIKYLKKQSRGKGMKANLASLLLDPDKKVSEAALIIASEILNR